MLGKVKKYVVPFAIMTAIVLTVFSFQTAQAGGRTWTNGCVRAHQYESTNYYWAASSRLSSDCSGMIAAIWQNSWLIGSEPTVYGCASASQVSSNYNPVYAQTSYSGSLSGSICSAHIASVTSGWGASSTSRLYQSSVP